jgi:hypothetical protein
MKARKIIKRRRAAKAKVVTVSFFEGKTLAANPDYAIIVDDDGRLWRISLTYGADAILVSFGVRQR